MSRGPVSQREGASRGAGRLSARVVLRARAGKRMRHLGTKQLVITRSYLTHSFYSRTQRRPHSPVGRGSARARVAFSPDGRRPRGAALEDRAERRHTLEEASGREDDYYCYHEA